MAKPNIYVLGSKPELDLTFTDLDDEAFTPVLMRLSVKAPDGTILTLSGAEMTSSVTVSGMFYYLYALSGGIGWYEYEGWGRDGNGREIAETNGFEVIDRVY